MLFHAILHINFVNNDHSYSVYIYQELISSCSTIGTTYMYMYMYCIHVHWHFHGGLIFAYFGVSPHSQKYRPWKLVWEGMSMRHATYSQKLKLQNFSGANFFMISQNKSPRKVQRIRYMYLYPSLPSRSILSLVNNLTQVAVTLAMMYLTCFMWSVNCIVNWLGCPLTCCGLSYVFGSPVWGL